MGHFHLWWIKGIPTTASYCNWGLYFMSTFLFSLPTLSHSSHFIFINFFCCSIAFFFPSFHLFSVIRSTFFFPLFSPPHAKYSFKFKFPLKFRYIVAAVCTVQFNFKFSFRTKERKKAQLNASKCKCVASSCFGFTYWWIKT